jgi:hypothetical protein
MQDEGDRKTKDGSEPQVPAPIASKHSAPTASAFKRGQRVFVEYGIVPLYAVVGAFWKKGKIHNRKNWRRGWYEVAIGWDVNTSTPILVTAHLSALTATK